MKNLRIVMAGVLLLTVLVMPSTSFGAQKAAAKTVGEMTQLSTNWWGSAGRPVTFSWQWNIHGAAGPRPSFGTLSWAITEPAGNGTMQTLETHSVNVVTVTRTAANVVEVTFDGQVDAPGDPAWPSNRLRIIDSGKTGDELLMWCWRCNNANTDLGIFHTLWSTGQLKVW